MDAAIFESLRLAIMLVSTLAQQAGKTAEEIKVMLDVSFEEVKRRDPRELPDV